MSNMVSNLIFIYRPPNRFMYEGNYHSEATVIPHADYIVEYLKEEIERASSVNPEKNLTIGIGIVGEASVGIRLAREASKRKELSDMLSTREIEIELREHANKFPNVKLVSINTGPCHICKRPIVVFGNYSWN